MNELSMKVLVSRPRTRPAPAPFELRRPDYCWTRSGEILTPPEIPCAEADTCGCGWGFAGVTSARATSWGVVEMRRVHEVVSEVEAGKHLAGWVIVDDLRDEILDEILAGITEISRRIQVLPVGTIVGIWALSPGCFSLYPRPRDIRARNARSSIAASDRKAGPSLP